VAIGIISVMTEIGNEAIWGIPTCPKAAHVPSNDLELQETLRL